MGERELSVYSGRRASVGQVRERMDKWGGISLNKTDLVGFSFGGLKGSVATLPPVCWKYMTAPIKFVSCSKPWLTPSFSSCLLLSLVFSKSRICVLKGTHPGSYLLWALLLEAAQAWARLPLSCPSGFWLGFLAPQLALQATVASHLRPLPSGLCLSLG